MKKSILLLTISFFTSPLQSMANERNIFCEPRPPLCFEKEKDATLSKGFVGGVESINLDVIKELQDENQQFRKTYTFPPLNEKIVVSLKQDFSKLNEDSVAQKLLGEIEKRSAKKKLTVLHYLSYYFRYAAAQGEGSQDEKKFFQHSNVDPLYELLPNVENWNTFNPNKITDWFHPTAIAAIDRLSGDIKMSAASVLSPASLNKGADYKLEKLYRSSCSPYVQLPLMGAGKMGIAVMLKLMLHKVHIMSFPDQEESAHSIVMSRKGFPAHDLAHSILQQNAEEESVFEHIRSVAAAYIKEGGAIQELTQTYIPYVIRKSEALNTGLLAICEHFIGNLGSEDAFTQRNARVGLVGLFYRIHELYSVLPNMYLAADLRTALETYLTVNHSINMNIKAADPLKTDRKTGQSLMSDDEIYQYVLENETIEKGLGSRTVSNSTKIDAQLVFNKTIDRSPLFIDVELEMKDGSDLKFAYPTTKYTLDSLQDELSLFKLAGYKVSLKENESSIDQINRIYDYGQTLLGNSRIIVNEVIDTLNLEEQFSAFEAKYAPKNDFRLTNALTALRDKKNK